MRWWYLSRLALEGRLNPRTHDLMGVYDRQPSSIMFFARIVSAIIAFAVFIFSLSSLNNRHSSQSANSGSYQRSNILVFGQNQLTNRQPVLNGTHFVTPDGTEIVYQRNYDKVMKGTVLLLHGCSHSAIDFFPNGSLCPSCIGLPQEMKMSSISLKKGYSVLAVSSTNRASKCWKTHPYAKNGDDYARIESALNYANIVGVYKSSMPLFAAGISSGGMFATSLPLRFPVSGVNSIVSSATCVLWGKDAKKIPISYPPHVFTHMHIRDKGTAARVKDAINIMTTLSIPVKEYRVSPKAITEDYLVRAIPHWGLSLSREVVQALKHGGIINDNNELQSDPRRSQWRTYVNHLTSKLNDSLVPDKSSLSEELNRAWASHEITAEKFSETLDFLERMASRR